MPQDPPTSSCPSSRRKHSKLPHARRWTLLCLLLTVASSQGQTDGTVTPLADRFDPNVETFAFIIPDQRGMVGSGDIKASKCGECHKAIYSQWKRSTHASALSDIQFQAELSKSDSPKWLCLNCHIPVQNQRETIVIGLADNDVSRPVEEPNTRFDPEMQREAVTCVTCHVRAMGPGGASVVLGPTGDQNAPHPVKEAREFLHQMCDRCHDPRGEDLTPNLVCWFDTKQELAAGQADITTRTGGERDCVDCHMPERLGHAADDYTLLPKKPINRHFWVGGGIPKRFSGYKDLLQRGYRSALGVEVTEVQTDADAVRATVLLSNRNAGHHLPTGDPERFILVLADLVDISGQSLQRVSTRVGQEWLWSPARKVGDNRLKQGETRLWKIELPSSADAASLAITALHVRMTARNAAYMMEADDIDEGLLPKGQELVRNAIEHYPMATYVYREVVDLATGGRGVATPQDLIRLSSMEQGKTFADRDY